MKAAFSTTLGLLLWPWRALRPRADLPPVAEGSLRTHLLGELWRACPSALVASVLATTVAWLSSVGVAVLVASFVEALRVGAGPACELGALAAMVLLRTASRVVAAAETLRLEEAVAARLGGVLAALHRSSASQEQVARLMGRDTRLLLDHTEGAVGLLALAPGLGGFFLYVAWAHSADVALALGSLALFLPVSVGLAMVDDRVFARVMDASRHRQEACLRWLQRGPVYRSWGRLDGLAEIRDRTATEVRLRNLDTVLRGADAYLVAFGRVLPFALLATAWWATGGGAAPVFESFWLALPLIGMVLDFPRAFVSARTAGRALAEIRALALGAPADEADAVVLDERWQVWSGTAADNLLAEGRHVTAVLEGLGLVGELGSTVSAVLARRIEPGGRDLSAGQQLRLLVARGLLEALARGVPLRIERDLASLDRGNQERLLALKAAYPETLILGEAAQATLHESVASPRYGAPTAEGAELTAGVGADAARPSPPWWRALSPTAGLLLAPAALVACVGHQVYAPLTPGTLVLLLGSAPLGVLAGVGIGWIVERGVRRRAQALLLAGLEGVTEGVSVEDRFQRVSQDFDTVNERVAWYLHDIGWMVGLAAVALASAVVVVGPAAILLGLGIGAGYVWLWRTWVPLVVETRIRAVEGVNRLLEAAADIGATAPHAAARANALRRRVAAAGMGAFVAHRTAAIASKTSLALYASGLAGGAIVLLAAWLTLGVAGAGAAAVVFTSAMAIDAESQRLLLALSGLRSQVLSLERLCEFGAPPPRPALVHPAGSALCVTAFRAGPSQVAYAPMTLPLGAALSLLGRSGAGKSQFLKSLAGVVEARPAATAPGRAVHVVYVDARWREMLGPPEPSGDEGAARALAELCGPVERPVVLAIDEALTYLPPDRARQVVATVSAALGPAATVLLVDHRFTLDRSVDLEAHAALPAARA